MYTTYSVMKCTNMVYYTYTFMCYPGEFRLFYFYFYELVSRENKIFLNLLHKQTIKIYIATRKRLLFHICDYRFDTLNYRNLIILILGMFL